MAELWKAQPSIVYENWSAMLRTDCWSELNDWEKRFVNSLDLVFRFKKELTQAQAEKLEQIYTKYTSTGSKFGD